MRKTNFVLGKDEEKLDSIFKTSYLPPEKIDNAKLNDEKRKDLRTHHFVFGNLIIFNQNIIILKKKWK